MAGNISPNTVTDGLVLCLDASNQKSYPGSGTTWYDLTGYFNNGTLTNGPTFNSANGGNIVFDGIDDYANCGNPLTFTLSFTIGFFFKTLSAGIAVISGIYNGSGADWWVGISSSKLNFSFGSPTKSDITSISTVNDNTWRYATCVYDKSLNSTFLYLNGVLQSSSNTIPANVNQPAGALSIGRFGSTSSFYWPGSIALYQLYNRALSAAEILQNFNSTKTRFGL